MLLLSLNTESPPMPQTLALMAATIMVLCTQDVSHGGDGIAVGQHVTQKRGFVCLDDTCTIVAKNEASETKKDHCFYLNRIRTIGVVVKVESESVVVEFSTNAGWESVTVDKFTYDGFYDFWGQPETFYLRPALDVTFEQSDCGVLLTGEEGGQLKLPARVRMPKSLISWPPPRFGDKVTRGPDWNKGSADLEPGLLGKIVRGTPEQLEPRDSDGYVTVEWEATKRKGRYRWDLRRKFDVTPVAGSSAPLGTAPEANDAPPPATPPTIDSTVVPAVGPAASAAP
jgi:hypothetical protein